MPLGKTPTVPPIVSASGFASEQTDFGKFLANIDDFQTSMLMQGFHNYETYKPTLSTFPQYSTGQDFFTQRPGVDTTDVGSKVFAALNLENLTGRIALGAASTLNSWFPENTAPPLIYPDGTIKNDYSVDDYIRQNEAYFSTFTGGQEVLDRYQLGYYDGMKPAAFIAAMGMDVYKGQLRRDLQATTGSGFIDFGATMAGALPDPATMLAGNALLAGGKMLVGVARGTAALEAAKAAQVARAAGTAEAVAPSLGKALGEAAVGGITQNTARSLGLTVMDPENHTFQEYIDNLAFGLAIDGGRALAWAGLKFALGKLGSEAHTRLKTQLDAAEVQAKTRINAAQEADLPDDVVEAVAAVNVAREASASTKGQLNIWDEGQPVPPEVKPTASKGKPVEAKSAKPVDQAQGSLFDGQGDSPSGSSNSRAENKPADVSVLTEQDRQTLLKIAQEQAKVSQTPIDDQAAAAQLEKIASRESQVFNYGRLDAMGLRKVKIEQPILNAFFQKIVPPEGFKLDELLNALKKTDLQTKLAALDAAGLKEAMDTFYNFNKDPEAAANAVLELGQKLAEGRAAKEQLARAKPIRSESTVAPGTFNDVIILDPMDYMPDRSNDKIKWALDKLNQLFGRPVNDVSGAPLARFQAMTGFAIKFELSDNPYDRAIFDIYSAGTAGIAMKGEHTGTVRQLEPYELVKRNYGSKANAAVQLGLSMPFRKLIAGNSFMDNAIDQLTSGVWKSPEQLTVWRKFNEMVERMRISRMRPNETSTLFPKLEDFNLADSAILDDYRDILFKGLSDVEAKNRFTQLAKELDDIGILSMGTNNNKKLSAWMSVQESRLISQITAIEIGKGISLEQLDYIFVKLFNLDKKETPVELPADFPYRGIARFAQETWKDPETGVVVRRRYGPATISEIQAAIKNNSTVDIVNRLVGHFNDNWGGIVPASLVEPLIAQYGKDVVRVSSEHYIQNSSRFLSKLALANNLYQRLKEFHVLEAAKYAPDESKVTLPIDAQIEYYQTLMKNLNNSLREGGTPTAEGFRNLTDFNEKALDALIEYNREVGARSLTNDAKTLKKWQDRTDELGKYLKARLGFLPSGESNPWHDAILTGSQALQLQGSGINMFAESAKTMANGLTFANHEMISNLGKTLLFDLRKVATSKENAGLMLESLSTLYEDIGHQIGRMTSETEGTDGFSIPEPTGGDRAKGIASAMRRGIGIASLSDPIAVRNKRNAFFNEYFGHTLGENSQFNLSAKILDKMGEGMSPIEATRLVAKEAKLSANAADNLFYHHSALINYFSHDEIYGLADFFKHLGTDKSPFKVKFILDPEEVKAMEAEAKLVGATHSDFMVKNRLVTKANSMLGSILAPDSELNLANVGPNFRDSMISKFFSDSASLSGKELNVGKVEDFYSDFPQSNNPNPADLMRKLGRFLDFAIDQKNLNIPTALSDYARMDNRSFGFKVLTQYLRAATAQIINTGYGMSNRGLQTRLWFTLLLGGVGTCIAALKAYLSGNDDKLIEQLNTTNGKLQFANRVLDYAGFLPVWLTKGSSFTLQTFSPNAFDKQSAAMEFLPAPVSTAVGLLNAAGGLGNMITGNDLSAAQKRWFRKIISANFLDTTAVRMPLNLINTFAGHKENSVSHMIDWLYAPPVKRN